MFDVVYDVVHVCKMCDVVSLLLCHATTAAEWFRLQIL